jgi:inhibitor of cysteine peptidase
VRLTGGSCPAEVELSLNSRGTTVEVRRGDAIVVCLDENAGTGYEWAIEHAAENVVTFETDDFAPEPGAGVGGGGVRTMRFRAIAPGVADLGLKLWREWEGHASVIDRYDVTVHVRD